MLMTIPLRKAQNNIKAKSIINLHIDREKILKAVVIDVGRILIEDGIC